MVFQRSVEFFELVIVAFECSYWCMWELNNCVSNLCSFGNVAIAFKIGCYFSTTSRVDEEINRLTWPWYENSSSVPASVMGYHFLLIVLEATVRRPRKDWLRKRSGKTGTFHWRKVWPLSSGHFMNQLSQFPSCLIRGEKPSSSACRFCL